MGRFLRLFVVAWGCGLCVGCASIGALEPAETLGRGNVAMGIETGYQAVATRVSVGAYQPVEERGLLDRAAAGARR